MDLSEEYVKEKLETVVGQRPDGSDIRLVDKIEEHRRKIINFFPDYKDPKAICVIPYDYAPKTKVRGEKDRGKGFINEWVVRSLLQQTASTRVLKYFVVHGHDFHKYFSENPDTAEEMKVKLREIGIERKDLKDHHCETDFILLHPVRGIIFIEVYGGDGETNRRTLVQKMKEKKEQCLIMCQTLKVYVKHVLRNGKSENELTTEQKTAEKQLDEMFDSFGCFAVLPSLSRDESPTHSQAAASVDDSRCAVLFREDCQHPDEFKAEIEKGFQDIENQQLYPLVYDIALSCVILMRTKIISNGLELRKDLQKQKAIRESSLKLMDRIRKKYIFLSPVQLSLVESRQPVQFVEGIAGSGKTLICFERIKFLAKVYPNDKILYLCFGRSLAEHMRKLVEQEQEKLNNVSVLDFVGFLFLLEEHCEWMGNDWLSGDYYCRNLVKGLCYLERLKPKAGPIVAKLTELNLYQHVLVDEYQDFPGHRRFLLEKTYLDKFIANPSLDGSFWVFHDNSQAGLNKYWAVIVPPCCEQYVTKLNTVYRGTHQIAWFYTRFCDESIWKTYQMGHEYFGQDIEIVYPEDGSVSEKIHEVIEQLKNEDYTEEDVLIIHLSEIVGEVHHKLSKTGCAFLDLRQSKGLESKVVIFVGTDLRGSIHTSHVLTSSDVYIAASRAQWRCVVIVEDEEDARNIRNSGRPKQPGLLTEERSKEIGKKK